MTSARDIQWGPRTNVALMTDEEVAELAEEITNRPEPTCARLDTEDERDTRGRRVGKRLSASHKKAIGLARSMVIDAPPTYRQVDSIPQLANEGKWAKFFDDLRALPVGKYLELDVARSESDGRVHANNMQIKVRHAAKRHGVSVITAVSHNKVYVMMHNG